MLSEINFEMDKIKAFCTKWKVAEFALFGSVLRDDFKPGSDVDVLLTFDPRAKWSLWDRVPMTDELEAIFDRKVDLVNKRGLEKSENYIKRESILNSAKVIYDAA